MIVILDTDVVVCNVSDKPSAVGCGLNAKSCRIAVSSISGKRIGIDKNIADLFLSNTANGNAMSGKKMVIDDAIVAGWI